MSAATAELNYHGCASPLLVELLANSSHLEAVNPVVVGHTRALQRAGGTGQYGPELYKGAPVCVQVILHVRI